MSEGAPKSLFEQSNDLKAKIETTLRGLKPLTQEYNDAVRAGEEALDKLLGKKMSRSYEAVKEIEAKIAQNP